MCSWKGQILSICDQTSVLTAGESSADHPWKEKRIRTSLTKQIPLPYFYRFLLRVTGWKAIWQFRKLLSKFGNANPLDTISKMFSSSKFKGRAGTQGWCRLQPYLQHLFCEWGTVFKARKCWFPMVCSLWWDFSIQLCVAPWVMSWKMSLCPRWRNQPAELGMDNSSHCKINIPPARHERDSSPSESIETCFRKTPSNTGNSQDYLKNLKSTMVQYFCSLHFGNLFFILLKYSIPELLCVYTLFWPSHFNTLYWFIFKFYYLTNKK